MQVKIKCPECNGHGTQDFLINCTMPVSRCCGGCTEVSECYKCEGSGEITVDPHEHFEKEISALLIAIDELSDEEKKEFINELSVVENFLQLLDEVETLYCASNTPYSQGGKVVLGKLRNKLIKGSYE